MFQKLLAPLTNVALGRQLPHHESGAQAPEGRERHDVREVAGNERMEEETRVGDQHQGKKMVWFLKFS